MTTSDVSEKQTAEKKRGIKTPNLVRQITRSSSITSSCDGLLSFMHVTELNPNTHSLDFTILPSTWPIIAVLIRFSIFNIS